MDAADALHARPGRGDDGTLFAGDSETADIAEFATVLLNGSAGEDEARSLPVGPGGAACPPAHAAHHVERSIGATAHANNAIATAGLSVLHNNLQSTSSPPLRARDGRRSAPPARRPQPPQPAYKGELLYLLSSSGGLARPGADGGSTTLWEAGAEWFTKGLAVDDVAYFGLRNAQARDRNFAAMELARSTSPPAASCGACAARAAAQRAPRPPQRHQRACARAHVLVARAARRSRARASPRRTTRPRRGCLVGGAAAGALQPAAGAVASAAAAAPAAACAARASSYPRTLNGVLGDAQRRHLPSLYLSRVPGRLTKPTSYNLLRALVEAADATEYALTRAALGAVQAAVASTFGDGFLVINDFFSYRAPGAEMFPQWHQDYEFWLTGDDCAANFNVWVLLDHHDLNHSFDVYEVERNRWLYDRLHAKAWRRRPAAPRRRTAATARPRRCRRRWCP